MAFALRRRHDGRVRVYLPLTLSDLEAFAVDSKIAADSRAAIAVTEELAATVETNDSDELELIAAMAAADLGGQVAAIACLETQAEIVDPALGEVVVNQVVELNDVTCLLVVDIDAQDLSWYGIQELPELIAATKGK